MNLTIMRGCYRHSHARIMANVDGINEVGFMFDEQIKIYEYARVFAPLPHMNGGKCELSKWSGCWVLEICKFL